ncbi:MAG: hypothetical protein ACXACI_06130 [Candidatus Hodarchaeales archaeon]|jgi:hypothetical protein
MIQPVKKWCGLARILSLAVLMTNLCLIPPVPASSNGIVALQVATCQFSYAVNDSLGLNATIWFERLINDSWMWEHNGTLTWVFDPNLPFWTFFYEELIRITADIAPGVPVRKVRWGLPVISLSGPASDLPGGFITDYNNGSHYAPAAFYPQIFENYTEYIHPVPVENLTFVFSEQWEPLRNLNLLPPVHWFANVYWNSSNLSDAEWLDAADRLSTYLNGTWYITSCHILKLPTLDNGAGWPIETVVLGLVVLLYLASRQQREPKKKIL